MKYIIVNSVKGGCGKSSISLRTAIDLALETKRIKEPGMKKRKTVYANNVLVIDMDILGSSLRTFVTGQQANDSEKDYEIKGDILSIGSMPISNARWLIPYRSSEDASIKERSCSDELCFTDLFCKKYNEWKDKEIEIPFCVCPDKKASKKNPMLHIAFSSEKQNVKNRFRTQKSNNYTLNINIRYYEEILRKYIKYLGEKALSKGKSATHIIFDMPPNSDPYSECVYSILLKILNEDIQKGKEGDNTVELRLVSSCDLAHISANLSWVNNMFEKNGWQYCFPSELVFVINDITGAAKVLGNSTVKEATIEKICKEVHDSPFYGQYGEEAKILWNDRDEALIFSSANKSCVSFSKNEFETRIIPAKSKGNSSKPIGLTDGLRDTAVGQTETPLGNDDTTMGNDNNNGN